MMTRVRSAIEQMGGRRFLLAFWAGGMSSFLVWFGKITSDAWAAVTIATVAAYIGGNTWQKNTAKDKGEADQ
jgi:hypothetical protein